MIKVQDWLSIIEIRIILLLWLFIYTQSCLAQKNTFNIERSYNFSKSYYDKEAEEYFADLSIFGLLYERNTPNSFYFFETTKFSYFRLFGDKLLFGISYMRSEKGVESSYSQRLSLIPESLNPEYIGYKLSLLNSSNEFNINSRYVFGDFKWVQLSVFGSIGIDIVHKWSLKRFTLHQAIPIGRTTLKKKWTARYAGSAIDRIIEPFKDKQYRNSLALGGQIDLKTKYEWLLLFINSNAAYYTRLRRPKDDPIRSFLQDGVIVSFNTSIGISIRI